MEKHWPHRKRGWYTILLNISAVLKTEQKSSLIRLKNIHWEF